MIIYRDHFVYAKNYRCSNMQYFMVYLLCNRKKQLLNHTSPVLQLGLVLAAASSGCSFTMLDSARSECLRNKVMPSFTFPSNVSGSPFRTESSCSIPREASRRPYPSQSVKPQSAKINRGAYTEKLVPRNGTVDMSLMTWENAQFVVDVSYFILRKQKDKGIHISCKLSWKIMLHSCRKERTCTGSYTPTETAGAPDTAH